MTLRRKTNGKTEKRSVWQKRLPNVDTHLSERTFITVDRSNKVKGDRLAANDESLAKFLLEWLRF